MYSSFMVFEHNWLTPIHTFSVVRFQMLFCPLILLLQDLNCWRLRCTGVCLLWAPHALWPKTTSSDPSRVLSVPQVVQSQSDRYQLDIGILLTRCTQDWHRSLTRERNWKSVCLPVQIFNIRSTTLPFFKGAQNPMSCICEVIYLISMLCTSIKKNCMTIQLLNLVMRNKLDSWMDLQSPPWKCS